MMKTSRELALALLLGGCVPPVAVTTPAGIIYTEENPPGWLVEHEQCHLQHAEEMDGINYWIKYYSDPEWGCNEEFRCGIDPTKFPDTYPMCAEEESIDIR